MKTWYQCKIKHEKENDEGVRKLTTSTVLVQAVNYTDAETLINEFAEIDITGEFVVASITKTNITEIIYEEDFNHFFKCKVCYSTLDDTGKGQKIVEYLIVSADHPVSATEQIAIRMKDCLVPYSVDSISVANIDEVYDPINASWIKEFEGLEI